MSVHSFRTIPTRRLDALAGVEAGHSLSVGMWFVSKASHRSARVFDRPADLLPSSHGNRFLVHVYDGEHFIGGADLRTVDGVMAFLVDQSVISETEGRADA